MLPKEKLDRINALAQKAKEGGLSEEEKTEQKALRQAYLAAVRVSFRGTLDSIILENTDGSHTKLKDRKKPEQRH